MPLGGTYRTRRAGKDAHFKMGRRITIRKDRRKEGPLLMHDALALQRPKNFRQRRWNVGILNNVETGGGGDTRRGVCVSATDETILTFSFLVKYIAKVFLQVFYRRYRTFNVWLQ